MKPLSISNARLIERRSDELDTFALINETRELLNQDGRFFFTGETTDATPMILWSMDLTRNSVLMVDVLVTWFRTGSSNSGVSQRVARFENVNDVANAGVVQVSYDDHDDLMTVTLALTAVNTLSLTVTGQAAQTIEWHARIQAFEAPWLRTT